jgi:hypothetical protein
MCDCEKLTTTGDRAKKARDEANEMIARLKYSDANSLGSPESSKINYIRKILIELRKLRLILNDRIIND